MVQRHSGPALASGSSVAASCICYACSVFSSWFACVLMQGPVPEGLGELGLRVALSVGELDKEAYQALYDAGRDRGGVGGGQVGEAGHGDELDKEACQALYDAGRGSKQSHR